MKEKNKRIHSGAVRVSRISDYLKLNESMTKKISSKTSSDIKVEADDMVVKIYRDMRSFASDFVKAYNQEDCEDLWSARDYLSNYEEDRVFCFSNPTNDRIYFCLELDYSSNVINVLYVYIDKDKKCAYVEPPTILNAEIMSIEHKAMILFLNILQTKTKMFPNIRY